MNTERPNEIDDPLADPATLRVVLTCLAIFALAIAALVVAP